MDSFKEDRNFYIKNGDLIEKYHRKLNNLVEDAFRIEVRKNSLNSDMLNLLNELVFEKEQLDKNKNEI